MKDESEAAIVQLERSAVLNPNSIATLLWRAATCERPCRSKEAAKPIEAIHEINPRESISSGLIQGSPSAVMARLGDGLRKAGLPE